MTSTQPPLDLSTIAADDDDIQGEHPVSAAVLPNHTDEQQLTSPQEQKITAEYTDEPAEHQVQAADDQQKITTEHTDEPTEHQVQATDDQQKITAAHTDEPAEQQVQATDDQRQERVANAQPYVDTRFPLPQPPESDPDDIGDDLDQKELTDPVLAQENEKKSEQNATSTTRTTTVSPSSSPVLLFAPSPHSVKPEAVVAVGDELSVGEALPLQAPALNNSQVPDSKISSPDAAHSIIESHDAPTTPSQTTVLPIEPPQETVTETPTISLTSITTTSTSALAMTPIPVAMTPAPVARISTPVAMTPVPVSKTVIRFKPSTTPLPVHYSEEKGRENVDIQPLNENATPPPAVKTSTISGFLESKDNQTTPSNVSSSNMIATVLPSVSTASTVAVVVPIVVGVTAIVIVAIVLVLVYRYKRRHRKKNIMKYKRHSQNGEVAVPLTSVSNDNYRASTRVSAHEEAVVYAQVDKTKRPPRPTYRYKTDDTIPLNTSTVSGNNSTLYNQLPTRDPDTPDQDTVIVDNLLYEKSPKVRRPPESPSPPKVPIRKSSCDSQASNKRTPASSRREISWPIPKDNVTIPGRSPGSPGVAARATSSPRPGIHSQSPPLPPSPRSGQHQPPSLPPSPRHGIPASRRIPLTPPPNRPVPPTPPEQHAQAPSPPMARHDSLSSPPTSRHEYDPVYIPRSDANAINRRLDKSGYVTSRRMRMNASNPAGAEPYEDVLYSEIAEVPLMCTRMRPTAVTSQPSGDSASGGVSAAPDTPSSSRTRTESKSESEAGTDMRSTDASFDTMDTSNPSNKISFSIEDISQIIDNSFGSASAADGGSRCPEPEYSAIAGEEEYWDNSNSQPSEEVESDEEKESAYEPVDFQ